MTIISKDSERSLSTYDETALADWLAILHAPRLGPRGYLKLLQRYGSPQQILAAADELTPALQTSLTNIDSKAVESDLAWLAAKSTRAILPIHSPDYPAWLRNIHDPPIVLFVAGKPACLHQPQLAIVGSRNPTAGGLNTAREFAAELATAGMVITSGLAAGIDAAAHSGALQVGGQTIAVTGNGLDKIYPARNKRLAAEIARVGALVSEFSPGTPPLAENFPRRNRIISGLSLGTLVVEAATRSGSLITARLAAEQGREVFAIPGSIHNPLARGCHRLLRDGACLVENSADIINELGSLFAALRPSASGMQHASKRDDDAHPLFAHLGHDPVDIDTLVERSGLTADRVSAMLLELELHGNIEALPGSRYCRT